MRRLTILVLCLAVVGFAVEARAASAVDMLYKDTVTINQLEDNDWETHFNKDTDPSITVGDLLVGMYEIQSVRDVIPGLKPVVNPTTNTFTGVFVLKVATKTVVGGGLYNFTFSAATAAEWAGLGVGLPAPAAAGTVGMVFDDSSTPFVNPNPAGPPGIGPALATATDGVKLWEVGFAGLPGEVWESLGPDVFGSPLISALSFSAAINTTFAKAGLPLLLPHNFVYNGITKLPVIFSQWQLTGRFETPGAQDLARFGLKTDTDLYIKPTPEPGSLALLGLGLLGLGGVIVRRRRS